MNENGQPFDEIFEGFTAVVVHHEIDHLESVLFIDRVTDIHNFYTLGHNENGETVRVPGSVRH